MESDLSTSVVLSLILLLASFVVLVLAKRAAAPRWETVRGA
jgi:ABC-type sulfate transport system permease component